MTAVTITSRPETVAPGTAAADVLATDLAGLRAQCASADFRGPASPAR